MKIGGIIGPYRLEEPVGGGGTLWTARHRTLDRQVAVRFFGDGVEREAFVERARVLARVEGPRVAPVVDSGFTEDGTPYLMTGLASGRDLATRLRREGPLTPREAVGVGRAVCEVLGALHRAGLAHGRLTAASVWLAPGEAAAVEQVDVAAAAGPGAGAIAPEEERGAAPSPAGDVFAVGALLYGALGGQRSGGAWPSLRQQLPLAGIPEVLDGLVARCLADEVGARPTDAEALGGALAKAEAALDEAAGDGWRLDPTLGPRDDESVESGWGLVTSTPAVERALEPVAESSSAAAPAPAASALELDLDHGLDLSGEPIGAPRGARSGAASPSGLALAEAPTPRAADERSGAAGWGLDEGAGLELARDPAAGHPSRTRGPSLVKGPGRPGAPDAQPPDARSPDAQSLDGGGGLELAFEPASRRAPAPPPPEPTRTETSTGEVPIVEPERSLPPAPEGPFGPGMRSARLATPPSWQERYRAGMIASGVVVGVLTLAWLVRGPMVETLGVEEATPVAVVDAGPDAEPRKLDIGPTPQVLDRGAGPAPALVRSGPLGDPGYEDETPTVLIVPDPGPATFVRLDDEAVICEEVDACKVPVDVDVSVRKAGYRALKLSGDDLYDRRGSRWRVVLRR